MTAHHCTLGVPARPFFFGFPSRRKKLRLQVEDLRLAQVEDFPRIEIFDFKSKIFQNKIFDFKSKIFQNKIFDFKSKIFKTQFSTLSRNFSKRNFRL